MFGSLPMFDFPELREQTDALWAVWAVELTRLGLDVPSVLVRPSEVLLKHWRRPGLLVSQTCGYPYATALRNSVTTFGTFAYEIPEEPRPGFYRSVIVARTDDSRGRSIVAPGDLRAFNGARVAVNATDSLSGCVSLGAALVNGGVTQVSNVVMTGAHANSLAALQRGEADVAAIDAVSFALFGDIRPGALDGVAIVGRGPVIPCLPLVTQDAAHVPLLQRASTAALANLRDRSPEVLRALRIVDVAYPHDDDYAATLVLGELASKLFPVGV